MPDRIRRVLDYIVRHYVVVDDQKDIDLNAPVSGGDLTSEKRNVARREIERASELSEPFRLGLLRAYQARRRGETEIALDDRDPGQNEMADALIRILVAHDLAESRSEATGPRNYVYTVAVDWPRLAEVGRAAGVDVEAALVELAR